MIEQHEIDKWANRIILFLDKIQGIDRTKADAEKKKRLEERAARWPKYKFPGVADYSVCNSPRNKRGLS